MEVHLSERKQDDDTQLQLIRSFQLLSNEARELYLSSSVSTVSEIPEALEFYRRWVAPNIPLIIKGGAKDWPAVTKWTTDYLGQLLKEKEICVAVTPNGFADAITIVPEGAKKCFALPDEQMMTMSHFLKRVHSKSSDDGICYIQRQNSNLTEDFPELLADIEENPTWASSAFDQLPTAINLWVGDERAVTSLHKDPFENIYCVISGWKEFVLYPPTDRPWLPYKTVPVVKYKQTEQGSFEMTPTNDTVPWIDFDPYCPDYETYPLSKNARGIQVRVQQGDILYLPSLWFHHVKQSQLCIAVNYWYDMNFDIKHAYYQFLDNLSIKFVKYVVENHFPDWRSKIEKEFPSWAKLHKWRHFHIQGPIPPFCLVNAGFC